MHIPLYINRERPAKQAPLTWAENETRTRDPNLGKVVLYQLSYFRLSTTFKSEENETRTHTT